MVLTFGEYGITDEFNKGITPESLTGLGKAVSVVFGGKIAVSHEEGRGVLMVKQSLIADILAGGANVVDFGEQTSAITMCGIKFYNLNGGFHISREGSRIEVFDGEGMYPAAAQLEKLQKQLMYDSEKEQLSLIAKQVVSLKSYKLYYLRNLLSSCRNRKIGMKIMLWIDSVTSKNILTSLLDELDCHYRLYTNKTKGTDSDFAINIKKGKFDFGICIRNNENKSFFCDGEGRILSNETTECIKAMSILCENGSYFATSESPTVIERMAEIFGGRVIRNKSTSGSLRSSKILFPDNGVILRTDPVGSVVKIMDFLKYYGITLAEAADMIPVFYAREMYVGLGAYPGSEILENLIKAKKESYPIKKGLRIHEKNGWITVLREGEKFKILSESFSAEFAEELLAEYMELISALKEKNKKKNL